MPVQKEVVATGAEDFFLDVQDNYEVGLFKYEFAKHPRVLSLHQF